MHELLTHEYIRIIGSTLTIYLFIIIAIRLFGKKELAQLSVFDLVFILLISNAVQNAMVGDDTTLGGGLVAAGSLFIVNYLMKYLQYLFPSFGRLIQGEALMLVYKGKINESHLHQAKISHEELMEAVREHGISTIAEVDLAILEVDGNISVLSHQYQKKTVKPRRLQKSLLKSKKV
jgi:uncharacterized membrane protein YcaP (DUF421 family)